MIAHGAWLLGIKLALPTPTAKNTHAHRPIPYPYTQRHPHPHTPQTTRFAQTHTYVHPPYAPSYSHSPSHYTPYTHPTQHTPCLTKVYPCVHTLLAMATRTNPHLRTPTPPTTYRSIVGSQHVYPRIHRLPWPHLEVMPSVSGIRGRFAVPCLTIAYGKVVSGIQIWLSGKSKYG